MAVLSFEINGQTVAAESGAPHGTLLSWLRSQGFTGAKEGCAEGECGACAVALLSPDARGRLHYQPVNSCLLPLSEVHGRRVVTVEGIASKQGTLHPVQQAMVEGGGSQCGYCTPGFVVSLFCEYYRPGRAGYDPESISGNLCRCTGYRPIVEVAQAMPSPAAEDPWLEPLSAAPEPLAGLNGEGYARPTSLDELLALRAADPQAVLIAGGTDLMAVANQRFARFPSLISVTAVAELRRLEWQESELVIGAATLLSHVERLLEEEPREPVGVLTELLPLFSSRLIRNRATLGGSLVTASPIGDSAPALLALGASVLLASRAGQRRVKLSEFFTGYRRTVLSPSEVVVSVHVPRPLPRVQRFYKVSKRVLDDISTVAAGFGLDLTPEGNVARLTIGLGGVAATPLFAESLQSIAQGKPWNEQTLQLLLEQCEALGTPMSDHRGSAEYRRKMIGGLVARFFYETTRAAEAAQ